MRVVTLAGRLRGAWINSMREDLEWCCRFCDKLSDMSGASIEAWASFAAESPRVFKRHVAAALESKVANSVSSWAITRVERHIGALAKCSSCDYVGSKQQVASHQYRMHGLKRGIRAYIDSTHCPICLQEFHTRVRVVVHAEQSLRCRVGIRLAHQPVAEEFFEELEDDSLDCTRALVAHGYGRAHVKLPVTRLQGPFIATAFFVGVHHSSLLRRCGPTI